MVSQLNLQKEKKTWKSFNKLSVKDNTQEDEKIL